MKLRKIKPINKRHDIPFITVSKTGSIRFSAAFITEIKFYSSMTVEFFQDEENLKDWYLKFGRDSSELRIREHKTKKACYVNNAYISKMILKSLGFFKSARMLVSIKPNSEGYYPIITKSARGE